MLYLVIVGAAAGFIATRMLKLEMGVIQTIALGIIGALVGGIAIRVLIAVLGAFAGLVGAILAVLALVFVYQKITGDR